MWRPLVCVAETNPPECALEDGVLVLAVGHADTPAGQERNAGKEQAAKPHKACAVTCPCLRHVDQAANHGCDDDERQPLPVANLLGFVSVRAECSSVVCQQNCGQQGHGPEPDKPADEARDGQGNDPSNLLHKGCCPESDKPVGEAVHYQGENPNNPFHESFPSGYWRKIL